MKHLFFFGIAAACLLPAQTVAPKPAAPPAKPKPAAATAPKAAGYLDKAVMSAWVRHFRLYPAQVTLEVSDPKPSDVPGMLELSVRASSGPASEQTRYYVTRDGSKIIEGRA